MLAYIASTVVSALLTPHPKAPRSALGDFSVPTASEGRAIPVIFGQTILRGGNTVWYGDLKTKAVTSGLLATILSFGRSTTIGYKYFLGVQMAVCQGPVDSIIAMQSDVKNVAFASTQVLNGNGTEDHLQLLVNQQNLFGGTNPGGTGGLAGTVDFYRGLPTQQPNAYLSIKQGRVVVNQNGAAYTFSGVGNGTLTNEEGGSSALDETITITAQSIDTNPAHSTYQKMKFSVVGSISGPQVNQGTNSDGSNACWADQNFSCPRVAFEIQTGSTQFAPGDVFVIQTLNSFSAPSYNSICYAVFRGNDGKSGFYWGLSNYLKAPVFVVQRCPDGLGLGVSVANIAGDANGAEMIYDLLTNASYGMGIAASRIDAAGSFTSAANTLATEGLGLSLQFDTQQTADQIIGEILRHIDGVLYADPSTGLWTLKLARFDYNPATIPVFDVTSVIGTPEIARASWHETTNLVGIEFISRATNFQQRLVRAYDGANISATNEVRPDTVEFGGISSETTAGLVATRVLKTLSYPLAKGKIVVNRSGWALRPGAVFTLNWAPLGITGQIFRVTRLGYGELLDGKITMDCIEDIFGIENAAFSPPPVSGWVNPATQQPGALADQHLEESPYQLSGAAIFILTMAARADMTETDYLVEQLLNGNYSETNDVAAFTPIGFLSAAYNVIEALDTVGFSLDINGLELEDLVSTDANGLATGVNLALFDDGTGEIISWQTVTANSDGTYTIAGIIRGALDTIPAKHAQGAKLWFFTAGVGTTQTTGYGGTVPADVDPTVKLLPENPNGTFPLASATPLTLQTRSRYLRPIPPGDLRYQGTTYGTVFTYVDGPSQTFTWAARNRITQANANEIVRQDAADITAEAGTTYKVLVVIGGTTVRTVTGITAESFVYNGSDRVSDSSVIGPVTLDFYSNANGEDSFYPAVEAFTYTGFGLDFGLVFGGETQ